VIQAERFCKEVVTENLLKLIACKSEKAVVYYRNTTMCYNKFRI